MDNGVQHEMVVTETFATGAQEWYCPVCGRRYILQWPPAYSKIVLEAGDETVVHVGGTGGVQMGGGELRPAQSSTHSSTENPVNHPENENLKIDVDDPYLSPFSDWLSDQNL